MYLPQCCSVSPNGRLLMDGLDVADIAREYGTPLYLMSEESIVSACRLFTDTLKAAYPGQSVTAYASKALSCKYILSLARREGLWADVVSGGELYTALAAGFDPRNIIYHGNNKTEGELTYALASGVGYFVADSTRELYLLDELSGKAGARPDVALRLKPGIEAHTHEYVQTGKIDSKFGIPMETDEALRAAEIAAGMKNISLAGLHCHIGSQIFISEPFVCAAQTLLRFAGQTGLPLRDVNIGGGFGIRYTDSQTPEDISAMLAAAANAVVLAAGEQGLPLPRLMCEPGRSVVGPAGITLYTVGGVKHIPGVRTYVSVDGGMTDNIRHALYGAEYTAALAERMREPPDAAVTIAGRACESGDLIGTNMPLANAKPGDILAIFATGAYNYSMASNYNRVPRPPIVVARGGRAEAVVRRETYEDLTRCDL
ncbi:MAG: diaminopimelate decarboxylase [Oscillospiraceae bacterium]|nr:diaminopimelate decarboxylase [Oscillospiraceae bacterium]